MPYTLMIVESPNKVQKISGFLGPDFRVSASMGHIRDLPVGGGLAIDFIDGQIIPHYVISQEKRQQVAKLRSLAAGADKIILATDPDREGEAIAWHLREVLGPHRYERVTFQAIERNAVLAAIAKPRSLNQNLVDAAQARRVIDRALGWFVSPTCKAGTGDPSAKSAGRVQSVALRLIAEREEAIQAHAAVDYHVLRAHLEAPGKSPSFYADLIRLGDEEVGQRMTDSATASAWQNHLRTCPWVVKGKKSDEKIVAPPPAFITSTVQQAASVRLGWAPDRTMKVLQSLFEGGHITYHRTDSPVTSPEGVAAARAIIAASYPTCLPPQANTHQASGSAQEAHEAIRPTHPEGGAQALPSSDEGDLYRLIWERFIASQMAPGRDRRVVLTILADTQVWFEAHGRQQLEAGWRTLSQDATEEPAGDGRERRATTEDVLLPHVEVNESLHLTELDIVKKTTKAPPRYTQASLIKKLEAEGIGRPSTYAAILAKILGNGYVEERKRALHCTATGMSLTRFLMRAYAGDFIEIAYTRDIEGSLDAIAAGKASWHSTITTACMTALALAKAVGYAVETDITPCPACGKAMRRINGKRGPFFGCTGYPACTTIINIL